MNGLIFRSTVMAMLVICGAALLAAETNYVVRNNPSAAPPYTNWATAAPTLQDAVNAAHAGNLVLVQDGVYNSGGGITPGLTLSNRVVIAKAIIVRSVYGPGNAVILGLPDPDSGSVGSNAMRCVYLGTNAVLEGFTVSNGYTHAEFSDPWQDLSAGGVFMEENATLSNCTVVCNNAGNDGGGIYANNGSTIVGCFIATNLCGRSGGGVYISGADSMMDRCVVSNNNADASISEGGGICCNNGAKIGNCLVVHNQSTGRAGGVLNNNCMMDNCTIVGNIAKMSGAGGVDNGMSSASNRNCIIYGNISAWAPSSNCGPFDVCAYCCTEPTNGLDDAGIDRDPLFVDPGANNFVIQAGSPCRNAGTNAYAAGSRDLAGATRVQGGTVDMGAYEVIPEPCAIGACAALAVWALRRRKDVSLRAEPNP